MINWLDIIKFANHGNPKPSRRILKTDAEWEAQLTPEQYRIARQHQTERAYTGAFCQLFEPALYGCVCCENWLFDSREKFESGTGWPSFTQPVTENAMQYRKDSSHGMNRIEVLCNVCDAHLGHIFPDGPMPSGLRYCINSAALRKVSTTALQTATFGGGCFWCTEAIFKALDGVESVTSGYSGGDVINPDYEQVKSGATGHAEVIQVIFDSHIIPYEDLVRIHLHTHNPTTLNRQGADVGTQYRSVIFYHSAEQKAMAENVLTEATADFDDPIVTALAPFVQFFKAEAHHQNFYVRNPDLPYCEVVITPKLQQLRAQYADKVKRRLELD